MLKMNMPRSAQPSLLEAAKQIKSRVRKINLSHPVTSSAVRSKAVVPVVWIHCLLLFHLFVVDSLFIVASNFLFCYALLCVLSSFASISLRNITCCLIPIVFVMLCG